jgi:hypothetical protein
VEVAVRALDAATLLAVWETGASEPPVRRALALLSRAWPDRSAEEWARAPLGERDARLLELRERLFGPRIVAVATCPGCQEQLEMTFTAADIRSTGPSPGPPEDLGLEVDGYEVRFRVPNSRDLLEAGERGGARAGAMLLDRCIRSARHDGGAIEAASLPEGVIRAVTEAMAAADPQADVQVGLVCSTCGHAWSLPFHVISYIWGEIEDWVRRTLREVHLLASAYGWSEREILELSESRRRIYLEMAAG